MKIISGIYKIVNILNNKLYIGSSKNITKRWTVHKCSLKNNRHHCIHLQRSWNKHGETAFKFDVIEELNNPTEQELFDKELQYITNLLPEYNVGGIGGGDNLTNNPNRDDIIKKITETANLNIKKMSSDERKIRWSRPLDKNPNWKGGISRCFCINCKTEISYGADRCIACSKQGELNSFYGKTHSLKTKRHLSKKMKGKLPINSLNVIINGIEYLSFNKAAKAHDVTTATIRNWLNGRKPHRKKIVIYLK